jgi:Ca-activated chloride channel homolog
LLVLDHSKSIIEADALDDLKAMAKGFAAELNLNTDHLGVVTFNDRAELLVPLSEDRATLEAAIDTIVSDGGTNIAAGIDMGLQELQSERRRDGTQPVLILVTDGRMQNSAGTEQALVAAQHAKDAGVLVISVGIGDGVDPSLLQQIASLESLYWYAPTSKELEEIYQEIIKRFTCE